VEHAPTPPFSREATDEDETELLARAKRGEDGAWVILVERHCSCLWRISYGILLDAGGAEDMVQEAFVKARARLGTFRGECSFITWLRAICRNACMDEARRRRRRGFEISLEGCEDQGQGRHGVAGDIDFEDQQIRHLDIASALHRLPTDERQAISLTRLAGYTAEEVAALLDVPASTIRSRVARAREKLAILLGG
jgi:RNA polymerase sigma-70 factor, ECF subfamily